MMPDIDGFEVCRRLKTNPTTQHIPALIVAALDQDRNAAATTDQFDADGRTERKRPEAGIR